MDDRKSRNVNSRTILSDVAGVLADNRKIGHQRGERGMLRHFSFPLYTFIKGISMRWQIYKGTSNQFFRHIYKTQRGCCK